VNYATTYNIQISEESSFNNPLIDRQNLTDTLFKPGQDLKNLTNYYWRVRATNKTGAGIYSKTFTFITEKPIPVAPLLILPEKGSNKVVLKPLFTWHHTPLADKYILQLANDESFNEILREKNNIIDSFYVAEFNLKYNSKYFWRVIAENETGKGDFSEVYSFNTILPEYLSPDLISPDDNATQVALKPEFRWGVVIPAENYRLEVSPDQSFENKLFEKETENISFLMEEALDYYSKYYWKVTAFDSIGNSGSSSIYSFTTVMPLPVAPVLLSPEDGEEGILLNTRLIWEEPPYSQYYTLQVAIDNEFNHQVVDEDFLEAAEYALSNELANENTYFWRVRANNLSGPGDWSIRSSFTTQSPSPVHENFILPVSVEIYPNPV